MINYRNGCNYSKYFRKLDKMLDSDYDDIFLYQYNTSCYPVYNLHWGQVKLLYSEMECLVKISKKMPLKDLLVVYVGAAPGDHTPLLLKLFPEINMLLYGPNQFNKDLIKHNRVIIKTGEAGWFNDDKVDEVKKIAGGRKILYISDIRREVDEKEILVDNVNQQNWGILMDADFMLLKLRMPYLNKEEYSLLNYNRDKIDKLVTVDESNKHNDSMLYLDGTIYTQLYPKVKSTETRLYVEKQGKYKLKHYSIYHYDRVLSYYNFYIRPKLFKYQQSTELKHHILGADDSYDTVGEYYLFYKYLKNYKKETDLHNKTIHMINNMMTMFNRESKKSLITLHIRQYQYEFDSILKLLKKDPNTIHINNIINFVRDVFFIIADLPEIYKRQYNDVINSTVLSKDQIKEQVNSFEQSSNRFVTIRGDKLTITPDFTDLVNSVSKEARKIYDTV